jgi:predicted GIY-YIG superfamily endonuclease
MVSWQYICAKLYKAVQGCRLIYYERFDKPRDAISREKEIKGWRREKKNDLVRALNPKWEDLGQKLFGDNWRAPLLRSG